MTARIWKKFTVHNQRQTPPYNNMTADVRNPQLCSAALKFDLESLKSQKIFFPGKREMMKEKMTVKFFTAQPEIC